MIQGTYYKEWSTVLGREMEFKVYGHAGVPVLADGFISGVAALCAVLGYLVAQPLYYAAIALAVLAIVLLIAAMNGKKRAQQAVKKGKVLTFHWRGSYLTRDVLREILNVLEDAGKEKSKLPHIYANAAQAVFRVWYSDIDTLASEIVLEDANEGEKTEKGLKNPE